MGPLDREGNVRPYSEWPDGPELQLNILNYHQIASKDDSDFSIELAKLKGIT